MAKNDLVGFIAFKDGIKCKSDALSKLFELELAGKKGQIYFPSLPNVDLGSIKIPFGGVELVQSRLWLDPVNLILGKEWGRIRSYPSGNSVVNLAIIKFEDVAVDRENLGFELQSSFNEFMRSLKRYLYLVCPAYSAVQIEIPDAFGLDLYIGKLSSENMLHLSRIGAAIRCDNSGNDYLSKEQIDELFQLACNPQRIKLEYNLLVDAYIACDSADYRKTIIEAASALEVSMTNKIRNHFQEKKVTFGEKLLKKYRMIGGLIELSEVLSIGIPKNEITKIKDARNNILHRGEYPNKELAKEIIKCARDAIGKLSSGALE